MRMTAAEFTSWMQGLLPEGAAWPRDPDAYLTKILSAYAEEYARAHNRAVDLIEIEADPKRTIEAIDEWEAVVGADPCLAFGSGSLEERRASVVARMRARGGQKPQFFIDLADALGFEVTITEYRRHTCENSCEDAINDAEWNMIWQINAPETTIHESTCESTCETPVRWWGNAILECVIRERQPAQGTVLFKYGEE